MPRRRTPVKKPQIRLKMKLSTDEAFRKSHYIIRGVPTTVIQNWEERILKGEKVIITLGKKGWYVLNRPEGGTIFRDSKKKIEEEEMGVK